MEINQNNISIEKNSEVNPQDVKMHLEDKSNSSLIQENVPNRKDTPNVVGQLDIVSINQHKRPDIIKGNKVRLKKVAKECNVSIRTIIDYLEEKGYQVDSNPNARINEEQYELVFAAFYGKHKVDEIESLGDNVVKSTNQDTNGINGESDIQTIVNNNSNQENEGKNTNISPTKSIIEIQNVRVPFSSLTFKGKKITLNYVGKDYYHIYPSAYAYNSQILKYKNIIPNIEWARFQDFQILVQLKVINGKRTFEFVNFDLRGFINEMREMVKEIKHSQLHSLPKNNSNQSKIENTPIPTPTVQIISLGIANIEFQDGFYLVWVLRNGEKDMSIAPLKINDTCSYSSLRFVQKYLSDRFPQGIQIIYTEKSIIKLTNPYLLSDYIRELHDNINTRGEWWEEVQNERKPSLKQCRQVTTAESNKKVSLKNGYLDSLSSLQNNQKLIPVYEINHGKQEDAFLFSIDMPNENCAIIFENISFASTATEIFIAKKEKYESCIELVFDYFTDYGIASKRQSLRRGINSPCKFNAEKYFAVNHCDLEQWLSAIFKILERTPKCTDIEFVSGLNIPEDSNKRTVSTVEISTQNIHNKLMRQLYNKLSNEYGAANVGTEIRVGSKRIDTVVKFANRYDIYEIKIATDPFSCVTLALGQLCQYAYLFCRDKIGRMVIVGPSETTKEVNDYLSWFRKTYSLQVHYMYLPI